jgi:hypothetical protein
MMHIVHSVFTETGNQNQSAPPSDNQSTDEDFALRLLVHQQVCHKYRDEIMAIRKYLPQWKPSLILNDRISD